MDIYNNEDAFLARWISGDLSTEELQAFKNHPDYKSFERIQNASEKVSFPEYDESVAFEELKSKLTTPEVVKKVKVISLYKWVGAIAASIVLLFGFLFYTNQPQVYTTSIAQQNTVQLPDGSEMFLNSMANANVDKNNWHKNRKIELDGEAYFKVKKGKTFTVQTKLGSVKVLGTQFTVNTIDDLFLVKCFEGKVSVTVKGEQVILTKGQAFQIYGTTIHQWKFDTLVPSWIENRTTQFNKVPINYVFSGLKRHYKIKITNESVLDKDILFTGNFVNTNLKKALHTVFGTLGKQYKFVSKNEITILK